MVDCDPASWIQWQLTICGIRLFVCACVLMLLRYSKYSDRSAMRLIDLWGGELSRSCLSSKGRMDKDSRVEKKTKSGMRPFGNKSPRPYATTESFHLSEQSALAACWGLKVSRHFWEKLSWLCAKSYAGSIK